MFVTKQALEARIKELETLIFRKPKESDGTEMFHTTWFFPFDRPSQTLEDRIDNLQRHLDLVLDHLNLRTHYTESGWSLRSNRLAGAAKKPTRRKA